MSIYNTKLLRKLANAEKWWDEIGEDDGELNKLYTQLAKDIEADSVSGKIALILLQHQLFHELLRELISVSTLYVQAEIWPTRFEPSYDAGKDRTTGWYVTYYAEHCIDCKGKTEFIAAMWDMNKIRNKVAHKLIGKNDSIVNQSYKDFIKVSATVLDTYSICADDLHSKLVDLTKRADFEELLSEHRG